jgi:hypothetical protein
MTAMWNGLRHALKERDAKVGRLRDDLEEWQRTARQNEREMNHARAEVERMRGALAKVIEADRIDWTSDTDEEASRAYGDAVRACRAALDGEKGGE